MLNRLSQQIRSLFSRPTRRRAACFGSFERLESRELLTSSIGLVADLNQRPNGVNRTDDNLVDVNGLHFFTAYSVEYGNELWRTDGTAEGTIRLTDLKTDREDTFAVGNLTAFQDRLYFAARDYAHGTALWVSDGSVEGTRIVADIDSTTPYDSIFQPVVTDDAIYFVVSRPSDLQVFRFDGSTGNLTQATSFSGARYYFPHLIVSGDSVYVTRNVFGKGAEIWKVADELGGEQLILELEEGATIEYNFAFDGNTLFVERSGNQSRIWHVDPTGTISEITNFPGSRGSLYFYEQVDWNGNLFLPFSVFDGTAFSSGLWVTDGTNEGSFLLSIGSIRYPVVMNNAVFYLDYGQLWKTDGTQGGTQLVGLEQSFRQAISRSGLLYLTGFDDSIWISDGTQAGTHRIESDLPASLPSTGSNESSSELAFWADDGIHGYELWVTDGSEGAAKMVSDLHPGTASSYLYSPGVVNRDLFVTGSGGKFFRLRDGHCTLGKYFTSFER